MDNANGNPADANKGGHMATSSDLSRVRTLSSVVFGECSRFRLDEFRTRFGTTEWFVMDAERPDTMGFPSVIRQAATRAEALAGLAPEGRICGHAAHVIRCDGCRDFHNRTVGSRSVR
jgi:hypothetical protein